MHFYRQIDESSSGQFPMIPQVSKSVVNEQDAIERDSRIVWIEFPTPRCKDRFLLIYRNLLYEASIRLQLDRVRAVRIAGQVSSVNLLKGHVHSAIPNHSHRNGDEHKGCESCENG